MVTRSLFCSARAQLAAILVLVLCASCNRLSSTERKVVGEWKTNSIGGEIVTTIRADHTWTSVGGCIDGTPPLTGRWRVERAEIIYSLDSALIDDAPPPKPWRQPIQQLIDDDRQVRSWAKNSSKK